jgi:hypothetical protein
MTVLMLMSGRSVLLRAGRGFPGRRRTCDPPEVGSREIEIGKVDHFVGAEAHPFQLTDEPLRVSDEHDGQAIGPEVLA